MRFFLDHNVPDSVADVFRRHGHTVIFLRDELPSDSPDPVVATVSEDMEAVLVSCDSDFRKKIAPRIPVGARTRFRKLSRIDLRCSEPRAGQRVEVVMSLIEAEFEIAQNSHDTRMHVAIGDSYIRTER